MSNMFLQQDLDALEALIAGYSERLRQTMARMGEAAQTGGNVWHDNFDFEQSQRDAAMYRRKISELETIRGNAVVIQPEIHPENVGIGTLVRIIDLDTRREETYFICGYKIYEPTSSVEDTDLSDEVVRVSYLTPMGNLLLNHRSGETVSGRIGNRTVRLRITDVRAG